MPRLKARYMRRSHRTHIAKTLRIEMWHHMGLKIDLILDGPGENEWPATLLCISPCFGDPACAWILP